VAIGRAADHAAIVAQSAQHLGRLVALVREQAVGVGVSDRDRLLRMADRIQGGAIAHMRAVDQDADAVHLAHDLPAEPCEAGILVLIAASAELVLIVVRELDDPHPQIGKELDEADAPVEQIRILEAEQHGDAAGLGDAANVLRRARDGHDVAVAPLELAPAADRVERFDGAFPEPECHGHAHDIGASQLLEHVAAEIAALQTIDDQGILLTCNSTMPPYAGCLSSVKSVSSSTGRPMMRPSSVTITGP